MEEFFVHQTVSSKLASIPCKNFNVSVQLFPYKPVYFFVVILLNVYSLARGTQPFLAAYMTLLHSRSQDIFMICQVAKTENKIYLTNLFDACGLILMLLELFRIVSTTVLDLGRTSSVFLEKMIKTSYRAYSLKTSFSCGQPN